MSETRGDPKAQFVRLLQSTAVSMLLHVVVLSAFGLVFVKSRELGRALFATVYHDRFGTEIEETELELDFASEDSPQVESAPHEAFDWSSENVGKERVTELPGGLALGTGRQGPVSDAPLNGDSVEPLARFSSTVSDRLSRQPAAKGGDYEIALYWNGPTDLDLHVDFRQGPTKYSINYSNKGNPKIGFLDVDQNAQFVEEKQVDDPIEHIRWETRFPPPGTYLVRVHGYNIRPPKGSPQGTEPPKNVPFTVEIKTLQGLKTFHGLATQGKSVEVDVLTITAQPKQHDPDIEAARLLDVAKTKLSENTTSSKRVARGTLINLIRRFPTSEAAREAGDLLRNLQ